jgi:WD40 repeat protein
MEYNASRHPATVQLWDRATGKPAGALVTSHTDILNLVFSPDGRRLATATFKP